MILNKLASCNKSSPFVLCALVAGAILLCTEDPASPNRAPQFLINSVDSLMLPETLWVGTQVIDTVHINDPDNDPITLEYYTVSNFFTIQDTILDILPEETDTGIHQIVFTIADNNGHSNLAHWNFVVVDTNHWPIFLTDSSEMRSLIFVGKQHTDTIAYYDKDSDDLLTLSFIAKPESLSLADSLISWLPHEEDTGTYEVTLVVADPSDISDTLRWYITVQDTNHWAFILHDSIPVRDSITVGSLYSDTIHAWDRDGDTLYFAFVDSIPPVQLVDSVFSWTPTVEDTGIYTLTVTVTDSAGPTDTLSWQVTVSDTNHWPEFQITSDSLTDTAYTLIEIRDTLSVYDSDGDSLTFAFIDSISGMIITDSVLIWKPDTADTGTHPVTVYVMDPSGITDTLSWSVHIEIFNTAPTFLTTPEQMVSSISHTQIYERYFTVEDQDNDSLEIFFIDSMPGMQRTESLILWDPAEQDTGQYTINLGVTDGRGKYDTLTWDIFVHNYSAQCTSFTHKSDGILGNPSNLPEGYCVYSFVDERGIYKTHLDSFAAYPVNNTGNAKASCLCISENGNWILYLNDLTQTPYVITQNGKHKTEVPVDRLNINYPRVVGLVRNSPYGEEIFYLYSSQIMKAVRVYFEEDTVFFGTKRTLVDFSNASPHWEMGAAPWANFGVVGDQVFGRLDNWVSGFQCARSEYVTIPDNGTGTASINDIYAWKDDSYRRVDGCSHTMTHDGSLCASVPSFIVETRECVPIGHIGVTLTEFRRVEDPPLNYYNENYNLNAVSNNFCPEQIRPEMEAWGWYFGNRNDYLIGRNITEGAWQGLWVVNWETNEWTQLNPQDTTFLVHSNSIYFGSVQFDEDTSDTTIPDTTDTTDLFDPVYSVISPNGGEQFTVGEVCSVKVSSEKPGNANLKIAIDAGKYLFTLPGFTNSINPQVDSIFTFTIPDYFVDHYFNVQTQQIDTLHVPSVSDSCLIIIEDYNPSSGYVDYSDDFFGIVE